jgi:hypothetical protein
MVQLAAYGWNLVVTSMQEKNCELEAKKVLITLALANTPAPLGYIADHTGINDPRPIVERLEARGWVRRCPSARWSCSQHPQFEVRPEIRKELWTYL